MNRKILKSLGRHLLGAALTATSAVFAAHPDGGITIVIYGAAVASACVPVIQKYLDEDETDFGRGAEN